MATVVCARGRWRVLCRTAADVFACLQCRKQDSLPSTPPSFLCSISNAALKAEYIHREREPPPENRTSVVDQTAASDSGADAGSTGGKKRRQKRSLSSQSPPSHFDVAQESDKVREYLRRRLHMELSRDADANPRDVFLLSCSLSDVEERAEKLLAAGFEEEWAAMLLSLFPPLWDVDVANVYGVFSLLSERGFGEVALKKIVSEHSYVLLEDRKIIEKRLNELLDVGIEEQQIVALFSAHPLLFGFPLGTDTITTIKDLRGKGFGNRWVASALLHCLHFRPSKVPIKPGIKSVMELMKELGVDVDDIMIKCPSFFALDGGHLLGVVQVLCGRPLYLDARDLHHMIQSHPELFIELCTIGLRKLQSHLDMLYDLFPSIVKLIEMVKKTPGILSAVDCELSRKVVLFKELGFTSDQLSAFIAKMPGFFVQVSAQDVEQRMRLFFSIPNMTAQLVLQSPLISRLLSRKWEFLQARYSYANQYNASVLNAASLQQLFWSSDESFAQLCNQTLDHFHSELGSRRDSYMEVEEAPVSLALPCHHSPAPTPKATHLTMMSEQGKTTAVSGRLEADHSKEENGVDCCTKGSNGDVRNTELPGEMASLASGEVQSTSMSCVKLAPVFVFKPDGVPTKWRSRNYAAYLKKNTDVLTFTCPVCGHRVGSESGYGKHVARHGSAYAFETPPLEWNSQFSR